MQAYPVATINLAALKHNLSRVKQLAPNSRVMSVIKANAYGHGAIEVASALADSDAFAVARLSEGVQLRAAGITLPIVILEGVNSAPDLHTSAKHSLSLVFHNESQIDLLDAAQLTMPLHFCWLMVETGMHRLGLALNEVDSALQRLSASSNISDKIGVMSHFANADVIDDERNTQQLNQLKQLMIQDELPTSMANSAAILSYPESHGDWLRPGLMLYGIAPFDNQSAQDLGLKPVMHLQSVITAIQELKAGDQVGYGGDWTAESDATIAIVSIGYGDGYSRQLSNSGFVLIQGNTAAVVGRVSMDMIAVDISSFSHVSIGGKVTLWGDDLAVERVAKQANTIPYELVCQVSDRVLREYKDGEA
ncbi:MAG: alanine racemase [Methylophaga sp.]|nr:alanine racemase [Methylophaga sp.]